jgi:hypothetical protein
LSGDNFGVETPILKWYMKIKGYVKMDDEKQKQGVSPTGVYIGVEDHIE